MLLKIFYNEDGESRSSEVNALSAIDDIALEFLEVLKNDKNHYFEIDRKELLKKFYSLINDLNYKSVSTLISYFHIYSDFSNLFRSAKIDEKELNFYKGVLSNSMTQHEQVLLFFISPMFNTLDFDDCEIFSLFGYMELLEPYAKEYHSASHFKHEEWKCIF